MIRVTSVVTENIFKSISKITSSCKDVRISFVIAIIRSIVIKTET